MPLLLVKIGLLPVLPVPAAIPASAKLVKIWSLWFSAVYFGCALPMFGITFGTHFHQDMVFIFLKADMRFLLCWVMVDYAWSQWDDTMQTNGSGASSFENTMHVIIDLHIKLVVQMFGLKLCFRINTGSLSHCFLTHSCNRIVHKMPVSHPHCT